MTDRYWCSYKEHFAGSDDFYFCKDSRGVPRPYAYCKPCTSEYQKSRNLKVIQLDAANDFEERSRVPAEFRLNELKFCMAGKHWKEESEFGKLSKSPDGLRGTCKECRRKSAKKTTPKERKFQRLLNYYGISEDQYAGEINKLNYTCPGCKRHESEFNKWVVDHDHDCCLGPKTCGECFRGLLCSDCNCILGLARDNPDTLKRLSTYLSR